MAVLKKKAEDANAWSGPFRLLLKTPQVLSVSQ